MDQDEFDRKVRETIVRLAQEKENQTPPDLLSALTPRARKVLQIVHVTVIGILAVLTAFILCFGYKHWTAAQERKASLHVQASHPGGPAPETPPQPLNRQSMP